MKPSVAIHYYPYLSHQLVWGMSFQKGLKRHGIEADLIQYGTKQDSDLTVFWGHGVRNQQIREKQIRTGRHYLVMERGFFNDRFLHCSLGFDGLNGLANYLNHSSPSSRWLLSRSSLKPWNPWGDYYLLIGQVSGDNSCNHINMLEWYDEIISRTQVPVMFRPHPLDRSGRTPKGARISSASLERDMAKAKAVITFSSTAGVDAMIAGKPVVAYDPISMVYEIAAKDVRTDASREPNREQWAYDLAYTQWNQKEIESGEAWEHLRGMYASG